jgi:hypothetical protein
MSPYPTGTVSFDHFNSGLTPIEPTPNNLTFANTDKVYIARRPDSDTLNFVFTGLLASYNFSCRSSDPSLINQPWYVLENASKSEAIGLYLLDKDPPIPARNEFNSYHYKPMMQGDGTSLVSNEAAFLSEADVFFQSLYNWKSTQVLHTVSITFSYRMTNLPSSNT